MMLSAEDSDNCFDFVLVLSSPVEFKAISQGCD